jgi:hypothetical protein
VYLTHILNLSNYFCIFICMGAYMRDEQDLHPVSCICVHKTQAEVTSATSVISNI